MVWNDKLFEEKMRPFVNKIYHKLFSGLVSIKRADTRDFENNEKIAILDQDLGIDTILYCKNGNLFTFQEKIRKNEYQSFNDFTFEYYNDPLTKEPGEWFKLIAQYYFYAYANEQENGFSKYWILNIAELRRYLCKLSDEEISKSLKTNKAHGRANFFCISFDMMPKKCILKSVLREQKTPRMAIPPKIDLGQVIG